MFSSILWCSMKLIYIWLSKILFRSNYFALHWGRSRNSCLNLLLELKVHHSSEHLTKISSHPKLRVADLSILVLVHRDDHLFNFLPKKELKRMERKVLFFLQKGRNLKSTLTLIPGRCMSTNLQDKCVSPWIMEAKSNLQKLTWSPRLEWRPPRPCWTPWRPPCTPAPCCPGCTRRTGRNKTPEQFLTSRLKQAKASNLEVQASTVIVYLVDYVQNLESISKPTKIWWLHWSRLWQNYRNHSKLREAPQY